MEIETILALVVPGLFALMGFLVKGWLDAGLRKRELAHDSEKERKSLFHAKVKMYFERKLNVAEETVCYFQLMGGQFARQLAAYRMVEPSMDEQRWMQLNALCAQVATENQEITEKHGQATSAASLYFGIDTKNLDEHLQQYRVNSTSISDTSLRHNQFLKGLDKNEVSAEQVRRLNTEFRERISAIRMDQVKKIEMILEALRGIIVSIRKDFKEFEEAEKA